MRTLSGGLAAAACVALVLSAGPATAQPFDILPQEQIVAGMKGYGFTDMGDGKGIQRFDVEILGLLKRYAPGQDLILGRVSGIGLDKAGIIAGMSGSPIYVDGKLVGALAYGWPFPRTRSAVSRRSRACSTSGTRPRRRRSRSQARARPSRRGLSSRRFPPGISPIGWRPVETLRSGPGARSPRCLCQSPWRRA
jgi:hypothetical protein